MSDGHINIRRILSLNCEFLIPVIVVSVSAKDSDLCTRDLIRAGWYCLWLRQYLTIPSSGTLSYACDICEEMILMVLDVWGACYSGDGYLSLGTLKF